MAVEEAKGGVVVVCELEMCIVSLGCGRVDCRVAYRPRVQARANRTKAARDRSQEILW